MNRRLALACCIGAALVLAVPSHAGLQTRALKPSFVSPRDLCDMLGVTETAGPGVLRWNEDGTDHLVTFRRNDAANLIVLEGEPADLEHVAAQAAQFDVAPRQIALEARIIEVDTDASRDMGFDWNVYGDAYARWTASNTRTRSAQSVRQPGYPEVTYLNKQRQTGQSDQEQANANLATSFRLLETSGAVTYRDTPRILTLNNQPATILDGQRTTYVTRYAAYTNLFETQTMDSGLLLDVTPSLGESGQIRLGLRIELTQLGGSISGSPVKDGQIVENTVMAKDGEPVVLGGFTRTSDVKTVRRLPVLGRAIPWLFSKQVSQQHHSETLVVITPRVVDLATAPDAHEKGLLQGR